ncbi:Nuclear Hormone Receptor family [Caenorhabditis elegans]|uniref:Nuclear Hormone Receptor family n=1 Tax=Caenorhabditis elegans TaxID=6239 RepID=A0A168H5K4_CAEEL|nr:Nuclear Hormone Receptor family [Caenorhabditis elegans]SAP35577.1 Nuclear Hormone Receptor family [Caenorhabditis elegans]|eukprot:NP_001317817.1 Nuclear Hormone Receptor family [Caenorhabditis elegans]
MCHSQDCTFTNSIIPGSRNLQRSTIFAQQMYVRTHGSFNSTISRRGSRTIRGNNSVDQLNSMWCQGNL